MCFEEMIALINPNKAERQKHEAEVKSAEEDGGNKMPWGFQDSQGKGKGE